MSLEKPVDSVLTHGGGADDAIASALSTHHEHHADQAEALYAGTDGLESIDRRHMHYEPSPLVPVFYEERPDVLLPILDEVE